MRVTFTETALEQYMGWQTEDKKTLKRINANRLVYTGDSEQNLVIVSCKGHYED